MNASLVTIPLAIVVALLLGKVAWPRAKTSVGRTRVANGLFVLTAALLVSALVAYLDAKRADSWVLAPEARTAAAVRAAPEGKTLTVMGRVSGQNPILSRNWAAFTECGGSCDEHYPDALLLDVEDGVVKVDDDSFLAIEWPSVNWGGHTTTYLEQSWPVLVVGDAEGDQRRRSTTRASSTRARFPSSASTRRRSTASRSRRSCSTSRSRRRCSSVRSSRSCGGTRTRSRPP